MERSFRKSAINVPVAIPPSRAHIDQNQATPFETYRDTLFLALMLGLVNRKLCPMADETTMHFLQRRERELAARIAALRGQLAPLEAELEKVSKMRALWYSEHQNPLGGKALPGFGSLADLGGRTLTNPLTGSSVGLGALGELVSPYPSNAPASGAPSRPLGVERYAQMSIKELIIQAFLDQFRDSATATELRDFIPAAYRRNIEASSFRSALHRLKTDGVLDFDNELWSLSPEKRRQYAMYDHPSSRKAMPELRDDPATPEEDS